MSTEIVPVATAAEINRLHHAAQTGAGEALQLAKQCGDRLLEVKSALPHGGFLPWLAEHCEVGTRQAQRYMRLARNWEALASNASSTSHLGAMSIDAALEHLAEPRAANRALTHDSEESEDEIVQRFVEWWKGSSVRVRALATHDMILPAARKAFGEGDIDEWQLREWEQIAASLAQAIAPFTIDDIRRARRRYHEIHGDGECRNPTECARRAARHDCKFAKRSAELLPCE